MIARQKAIRVFEPEAKVGQVGPPKLDGPTESIEESPQSGDIGWYNIEETLADYAIVYGVKIRIVVACAKCRKMQLFYNKQEKQSINKRKPKLQVKNRITYIEPRFM